MTETDRPEAEPDAVFERLLERALDLDPVTEALARRAGSVCREELRDSARRAHAEIVASAAAAHGGPVAGHPPRPCRPGGQQPVTSLLAPRLSAVAGLVLLLSGYAVRSLGGRPYVGDGLIMAGVLICTVAVGAAVGDFLWLAVAALRRRDGEHDEASSVPDAADPAPEPPHAAWELALLDRGLVPFLLRHLDAPPPPGEEPSPGTGATPHGTVVR
ncbi:hypothetical protein [Streptomyces sp. NPDC087212]|uniref:hypothetical protein n=1 Tax=Streptomyces sp. NPDC087212 TaxID=3365766 RepID=UPI00381E867A